MNQQAVAAFCGSDRGLPRWRGSRPRTRRHHQMRPCRRFAVAPPRRRSPAERSRPGDGKGPGRDRDGWRTWLPPPETPTGTSRPGVYL